MLTVTIFVELLAVLSTGYLIAIACLFLGYFFVLDLQFIKLFSVFDFTSQGILTFPLAILIGGAASSIALVRKRIGPEGRKRSAIAIGVLVAVLAGIAAIAEWRTGIGTFDRLGIDNIVLIFAVVLVFSSGTALQPVWPAITEGRIISTDVATHALLGALSFGGGFIAGGTYWALVDISDTRSVAFSTIDGCIPAVLLKSSSSGVLILNRATCTLEFRSYERIRNVASSSCPLNPDVIERTGPCTIEEVRRTQRVEF